MVRVSKDKVRMGAHPLRRDVVTSAEILPNFLVFCQNCPLHLLGVATARHHAWGQAHG